MKKLMTIILILICLSPIVMGADTAFTLKKGETGNVILNVLNNDNSPTTASTDCYLTVRSPDLVTLVNHEAMTFISDGDFSIGINATSLDGLGEYPTLLSCTDGTYSLSSNFYFGVTQGGKSATMTIWLFGILFFLMAFFLVMSIFGNTSFFLFVSGGLSIINGIVTMIYGVGYLLEVYTRMMSLILIGVGLLLILGAYLDGGFGGKDEDD